MDAQAALDRVLAIHSPYTISTRSHLHDERDLLDEQHVCDDDCFTEATICKGDGTAFPCATARAIAAPDV